LIDRALKDLSCLHNFFIQTQRIDKLNTYYLESVFISTVYIAPVLKEINKTGYVLIT